MDISTKTENSSSAAESRIALCILVVDDNEASANTLAELLEIYGHNVRIAYDGANALATALDHQPHVVILDLNLPGLDGFELCRIMRHEHGFSDALFIAHTGRSDDDCRKRAKDAGFDHFLSKPAAIVDLTRLIDAHSQAQREAVLEY